MKANIVFKKEFDEIPSASGLDLRNEKLFVVGDDSPWLFVLNKELEITDKIEIFSTEFAVDGRIPKIQKPDFEAMTFLDSENNARLLIFGSGSKSPERDVMISVQFEDKDMVAKTIDIGSFYDKLRKFAGIKKEDFNIEAAASWNNMLLLFNRGTNTLLMVDSNKIEEYIAPGSGNIQGIKLFHFSLPEIDNITAGFSGACIIPGKDLLLFSASVENTPDWYNDGEILGSFIGLIDLKGLQNSKPVCVLVEENNKNFKGKIEALTFIEQKNEQEIILMAATDNDNGKSTLLRISLILD